MPTMTKLSTYVRNTGTSGCSASQSVPCGTLSSSTMIVIRIAITPSLNPSRRPFVMRRLLDVEFAPTVEVSAPWPPAARLVRVPKKVARHHVYVIELDPAVLELTVRGGAAHGVGVGARAAHRRDRKSTRLNSSHDQISYAVFCLKKKN